MMIMMMMMSTFMLNSERRQDLIKIRKMNAQYSQRLL